LIALDNTNIAEPRRDTLNGAFTGRCQLMRPKFAKSGANTGVDFIGRFWFGNCALNAIDNQLAGLWLGVWLAGIAYEKAEYNAGG
jgi:hypothetical protein